MSRHLCLLFLFLTLDVLAHGNSPSWPTSCSMSQNTGKRPLADFYSSSTPGSESLCRGKCEGDSSCGMYGWMISDGLCELHHTSVELVTQVMEEEQGVMMWSDSAYNMGSKKCEGVIYDHTHCPEYPMQYEGKGIHSKHRILRLYPSTSLTPSQCQHLCSTYPQCRSVWHYVWSFSQTFCYLYSTTITELLESGKEDEVLRWSGSTTYERYCGDVPYHPSSTA